MIPFELTDDNHLKWYVGDELYGKRRNAWADFRVTLGHTARHQVLPFKGEFYSAMSRLVDTHGPSLNLFYSGGADSEVVARVLLDLGVKPIIHTVEFVGGANAHETAQAVEFCSSFGLTHHRHQHDMIEFLDDDVHWLAQDVECSQIAYLTVLHHARRCQDFPVVMGGEVYLQKHQKNDGHVSSESEWYYIYREDEDACTYRYSQRFRHPLINEVFTYTPGLLYSYLTHPIVADVANNRVPGKITLLSIKKLVYEQMLGYPLLAQTKFHGYEALPWTNRLLAFQLKEIASQYPKRTARLEYHQLLKDLICE